MSNEALNWAFRQEAPSAAAKFVLVAIADQVRDDNSCFHGQATLAVMTNHGERTVRRALAELDELGLIKREHRFSKAGHRTSDRYVLMIDAVTTGQSGRKGTTLTTGQDRSEEAPPANTAAGLPANLSSPPANLTATTGQSGQVSLSDPKEIPKTSELRADVERICEHLADRIEANGSKRPLIGERWRISARLLLDVDERTEKQVHTAIDWCQNHEFWRSNVLSMPKLREQYDQMRLQAQGKSSPNDERAQRRIEARRHNPLASAL